jgi:hydroxymethylglutaryl-CoA lyase
MASFPASALIREVGLRDGLQSILSTDQKIEWITDAYAAGSASLGAGAQLPGRPARHGSAG